MKLNVPSRETATPANAVWTLQLKAVALTEPSRLLRALSGSIRGGGGWVLSRGITDGGSVNMLFEFERRACVEVYTALMSAGLELSQSGHQRLTELCQCTRNMKAECGSEVVTVDLEVQTFPVEDSQGDPWQLR